MLPLNKGGLNRDLTTGLTDGHVLIVTAGAADFGALTATSLRMGVVANETAASCGVCSSATKAVEPPHVTIRRAPVMSKALSVWVW
jgi:hypothetical protein